MAFLGRAFFYRETKSEGNALKGDEANEGILLELDATNGLSLGMAGLEFGKDKKHHSYFIAFRFVLIQCNNFRTWPKENLQEAINIVLDL